MVVIASIIAVTVLDLAARGVAVVGQGSEARPPRWQGAAKGAGPPRCGQGRGARGAQECRPGDRGLYRQQAKMAVSSAHNMCLHIAYI